MSPQTAYTHSVGGYSSDSLRSRYRRPVTYTPRKTVILRDVAESRLTPRKPTSAPPAIAPQAAPQPADPPETARAIDISLANVPAAPIKRSPYLVKPNRAPQIIILCMSLAIFVLGGYVSLSALRTNQEVTAIVNQSDTAAGGDADEGTESMPSTSKPTNNSLASYTVAPDMPRYLSIPDLDVRARVRHVGTNDKGQVAAPSNVHDTAWYNNSAKPGTPGAALIDGHVSSWTTKGVFYGLKQLSPGAIVEVERGDGQKLRYRVVKSQIYSADQVDMATALRPVTTGKEGLNLITCTGKVKKGTSEFEQRLVVFTERIN